MLPQAPKAHADMDPLLMDYKKEKATLDEARSKILEQAG